MPKIRFIAETFSSVGAHPYHFGWVTSTLTGRRLAVQSLGGQSNLATTIRFALGVRGQQWEWEWDCIHAREIAMPLREWQVANRRLGFGAIYEHTLTAQMILNLEDPS